MVCLTRHVFGKNVQGFYTAFPITTMGELLLVYGTLYNLLALLCCKIVKFLMAMIPITYIGMKTQLSHDCYKSKSTLK